jgi:type 1 glutamine amidotransferase
MKKIIILLCVVIGITAFVILFLFTQREIPDNTTKTIAFIAGTPSHGEGNHEWEQDAQFLKQCLHGAPNIEDLKIDIYYDGWPKNSSDLGDADAIVFLSDGSEHHPLKVPERLAQIRKLTKQGVGLAFLHYSIEPPEGAESDFLEWMGGYYKRGYSQNPINTVKITPVKNNHPISRGCDGYVAEDEWYFDIRLSQDEPMAVPIMTGKLPPWKPEDKTLAWAVERRDGGRGFGFSGGHYEKNWHMEPFRKLILNAILWVAKVDIPETGVSSVQSWRFVSIPDFVNVDLIYPQPGWEDTLDYALKAIKAENPEFVLVAGDLVMGRWPDKESIKKYASIYYPAWIKRMQHHDLKFYTAIGDHEIGDNPWRGDKVERVSYFKRQFQRYLKMSLNGPLHNKGTAFWFIHENTLFISVDVFEKGDGPQGGIIINVTEPQLEWFDQVINDNSGVENIIVMGHTPILGPVQKENSSGLMLEGGRESPFWKAMVKHGVDIYLCGEVHAITCSKADNVLQIAHGGLFGYNPRVNYLVGTVSADKINLELKEIEIVNQGNKLWQEGTNRPCEEVLIHDEIKRQGFITVGTATLDRTDDNKSLINATGYFVSDM